MLELYQIEQLLVVAEQGTLSKAAIELHLSQPALSRSMKRMEEELQVELFDRQKNRIILNENGKLAVEYGKKILLQLQDMTDRIRTFDRSQRTISVGSCAPAPLWNILPSLTAQYPDMTISSELKDCSKLINGLQDGTYQLIIMPYPSTDPTIRSVHYGEEHLYFSLPLTHPLASAKTLGFKDLDGENVLLLSQIGFWHEIHKTMMPNTIPLLQKDQFSYDALVKASDLPSFTSDLAIKRNGKPENRVIIPISDPESHATYYCWYLANSKAMIKTFVEHMK